MSNLKAGAVLIGAAIVLYFAAVGVVKVFTDKPSANTALAQNLKNLTLSVENRPLLLFEDNPFHGKLRIVIKSVPVVIREGWSPMTRQDYVFAHPQERWRLGFNSPFSKQKLIRITYPYTRSDDGQQDEWILDFPHLEIVPDKVYVLQVLEMSGKPTQSEGSFFFTVRNGQVLRAPMLTQSVIY